MRLGTISTGWHRYTMAHVLDAALIGANVSPKKKLETNVIQQRQQEFWAPE